MEYINIGTDKILREYMCDVIDTDRFYKPAGGLWCTDYNSAIPNRAKWLDYMLCYPSVYCQKMDENDPFRQKGVIVDVNAGARVFDLVGPESFEEFKRKYGRDGHISYEELSKHYDAVHIGVSNAFGDTPDQRERFLRIYAVDSLCVFDLDIVDGYRKVKIEVEPFDYESGYIDYWPDYTMDISSEKVTIPQVSQLYMEVYNRVMHYYRSLISEKSRDVSNYFLASTIGKEILSQFAKELQKLKEQEQLDEKKVAYAIATKVLRR